jgi:DNA-binding NtrC family response regulator
MGEMRPSFLAVPLADTKFNRAKSNISVLEAAWMGALPIAPRWLEGCALPGVLLYNDQNDFPDALRRACEMPEQERLERLADLRAAINASPYELRNANMQRALILASGPVIQPEHVHMEGDELALRAEPHAPIAVHVTPQQSATAATRGETSGLCTSLSDAERDLILEALRSDQGNRQLAAKRLGISPRTLRYKLAKLREAGIDV